MKQVAQELNTNLLDADNLTGGLLELAKLPQEVPEARLGHNVVRCKDPHPVQGRIRLLLGGQFAPDHLVLLQL